MPNKIKFSLALPLLFLVCSVSSASEENLESSATEEVSFGFRVGMLHSCLESSGYDPPRNESSQNVAVAAFCLCYLEEMTAVAEVRNSQVILPTDRSPFVDRCQTKVNEEIFSPTE